MPVVCEFGGRIKPRDSAISIQSSKTKVQTTKRASLIARPLPRKFVVRLPCVRLLATPLRALEALLLFQVRYDAVGVAALDFDDSRRRVVRPAATYEALELLQDGLPVVDVALHTANHGDLLALPARLFDSHLVLALRRAAHLEPGGL